MYDTELGVSFFGCEPRKRDVELYQQNADGFRLRSATRIRFWATLVAIVKLLQMTTFLCFTTSTKINKI